MGVIAVITGDLVNSSQYSAEMMEDILLILKEEFKGISKQFSEKIYFSLHRGDSFQAVVEEPDKALSIALFIKAAVRRYADVAEASKSSLSSADIRISIGIGEATFQKDALSESNGEAFQFSGRALDAMKSEGLKMSLTTPNTEVNKEFKVHLKFLDAITNRWSLASAEVVYYLLNHHKEQEIANMLNRSQAAINQRKKVAGWEEIKLLLERYEQIAKKYFS
jgi:GGDEF domain-containing protein